MSIYIDLLVRIVEMFGETPYLRYPLWRFSAAVLVVSTAVSGLVLIKLRRQENMRRKKWEEFFKNYDAYEHVKEICSQSPGILHSCPKDLALAYEKAGLKS
uniref:COX6C domain-containing protein n=1 Tax=Elaeophora elaphi TaxID=1147741 RepID=A0A0R3S2W4_9BILA